MCTVIDHRWCNLFVLYNKNSNGLSNDFGGMKREKQVCWRDLTWIWRHLCVCPLITCVSFRSRSTTNENAHKSHVNEKSKIHNNSWTIRNGEDNSSDCSNSYAVLLYCKSYFRWNRVFSLAETRHVPVRKFPYWTGPDYGFRQPFCLKTNNERKLWKAAKNLN